MERIAIYGAGKRLEEWFLDKTLLTWLSMHGYEIVGVFDSDKNKTGRSVTACGLPCTVKGIGEFKNEEYDLIAVTTEQYFTEIKNRLVKQGAQSQKIIIMEELLKQKIDGGWEYPYTFSIAAIVKDEVAYLEEWIQFHRCIGVDHFYLYDNSSTDGTAELLKRYEEEGLVTYLPFPGTAMQVLAYQDVMQRFQNESKYIAVLDADEFLFPMGNKKIVDVVEEIFSQHRKQKMPYFEKNAGAIGVNWRVYGTSFLKQKTDGLVIRRFRYRKTGNEGANIHIKCIFNPRAVVKMEVHFAKFVAGYCCISENGSEIPGAYFRDGRCRKLRINHYVTKSEEEYIERKKRGRADACEAPPSEESIRKGLIQYQKEYNRQYDPILLKYADQVENMIKESAKMHGDT